MTFVYTYITMQDIIQLRTVYLNNLPFTVCHWTCNGQFLLFARVFPAFYKREFSHKCLPSVSKHWRRFKNTNNSTSKNYTKLKHWQFNAKIIYYKLHIALHTTITTSSRYHDARLKYEGKRKGIANRHYGEKRVERTCFWSYPVFPANALRFLLSPDASGLALSVINISVSFYLARAARVRQVAQPSGRCRKLLSTKQLTDILTISRKKWQSYISCKHW